MLHFTVLMNSIVDNQRDVLLSVLGTNIWSGQQPQQYNSQAIAWGGLRCGCFFFKKIPSFESVDDHPYSHELFAVGKRYQFVAWAYLIGFIVPVPFWIVYKLYPKLRTDYLYTPIIWYVEHPSFFDSAEILMHLQSAATTLVIFVLVSTRRSFLSLLLDLHLSGG